MRILAAIITALIAYFIVAISFYYVGHTKGRQDQMAANDAKARLHVQKKLEEFCREEGQTYKLDPDYSWQRK